MASWYARLAVRAGSLCFDDDASTSRQKPHPPGREIMHRADDAQIPRSFELGSCTMKLNATTELIPVSWPEIGKLHPFAPVAQASGLIDMIRDSSTNDTLLILANGMAENREPLHRDRDLICALAGA